MEAIPNLATLDQLVSALPAIRQAPSDGGPLRLIVRRPDVGRREIVEEARLDVEQGLVGDSWKTRGSSHTPDGSADRSCQITLMNPRVIAAIAGDPRSWPLAGDQLYLDIDLSADNLPPGSRLALGSAILEISSYPHAGCKKFAARFGKDALKFVNTKEGMRQRLRGVNATIIQSGTIRVGDRALKTATGTL